MKPIAKSSKLANVCYDIRGPVLDKARQMQEEGHKIIQLNIGNLAVFGLEPPDEIVQDMIRNMPHSAGYTDSKGLFAPRKAVVHYTQEKHIRGVTVDDVYLGNGASELITMSLNALLNTGDEVLIPAPDYPLYTASVALSGGTPVHYLCDEQSDWMPDIEDIKRKVTSNTKAIVVINPNNPTGALYPESVLQQIVEVARQHQLIILADEIYDKTLYDGNVHTSIASLADDVLCLTFNGLSKNYRSCGYRAGWMVVSGEKKHAQGLHRGPEHAGLDAAVLEHAGAAGDPDGAGRLPEHQGPGRAGRAAVPPARPGLRAAHADPGRQRRQAEGGAVHVPATGPEGLPDRRRPAVRLRTARRGKGADRAGHRLQLADAGPLPPRLPAQFRRPHRRDRAHRPLPRALPQTSHALDHHEEPSKSACSASAPSAAAPSTCCSATRKRSSAAPAAASASPWWPISTRHAPRPSSATRPRWSATRAQVIANPDIDIVVELIGGYGIARTLVMEAIAAGKHVVTANKALLAVHGTEIFAAAREKGVVVAFEAAVAGGIPIIKALREGLTANRIEWIAGIINGTTNFILSEMRAKGLDFGVVLKEAQRLGYAEADPTFDIEGVDAAHKATIMSAIAFGIPVQFDKAHVEGITKLQAADIRYAEQLGYRIKLLGITKRREKGIELRVHPTLIPSTRLIANVEGAMNAVVVHGDAVGTTLYYGKGAGAEPTASAVIADLVDITRLHTADPDHRVPYLAFQPGSMQDTPILPMAEVVTSLLPASARWPTRPACWRASPASWPSTASRSMRCCSASPPRARRRPT